MSEAEYCDDEFQRWIERNEDSLIDDFYEQYEDVHSLLDMVESNYGKKQIAILVSIKAKDKYHEFLRERYRANE